jgi:hypothetical protein
MNFGFSFLYAPSRETIHVNVNGRKLHSTGISAMPILLVLFFKTVFDSII